MNRLLLLGLALAACTAETTDSEVDTTDTTDTDTTDTDTTDTDTTVELPTILYTLRDYSTDAPIVGATLTIDGSSVTTDESGEASITHQPSTYVTVSIEAPGYPVHQSHRWVSDRDTWTHFSPVSTATLEQLSAALQIPLDPDKALFVVDLAVVADDTWISDVVGATVDIDVAYDVALVTDPQSPFGISPGTTTLEGGNGQVIFVNASPGAITPTLTLPDGLACDRAPTNIEAAADQFTFANFGCTQ